SLAAGGRVLARAGDTPLIAERRVGAGRVLVSAFDLAALEGEPRKAEIWQSVFGAPDQRPWEFTIQPQAQANAGLGLPSISMLAGLLFGYVLVVGPLNFLVLRRLDRREWAWGTIPLSVLLFTAVAYGAGAGLRQASAQLVEVSVVEGAPGAADGRLVSAVGFLAGQRGTWTLRLPKGVVAGRATWDRFGAAANPISVEAEGLVLRDQAANVGETREVVAAGAAPLPFQIEAALASDASLGFPFSGTVTLAGGELGGQAFVVYGDQFVTLPDLVPGAPVRLASERSEFGFPYALPDVQDEERSTLSNLFTMQDPNGNPLSPSPMLVVLRREQALNAVLEGGTSASGLTVYVIHLPTEEQ
ncbi:MAG TPA: hypothetical protein VGE07_29295, partial [Herpetosiphonaceae bacterium]